MQVLSCILAAGAPICTQIIRAEQYHKSSLHFTPIAIETGEVFGPEATTFFKDLYQHLRTQTEDPLAHSHFNVAANCSRRAKG